MKYNTTTTTPVARDTGSASVDFFGIPIRLQNASADAPRQLEVAQLEVLNFLRPKPCPVGLLRIGGNLDGAYLLPRDLAGIVGCFSPGVKNRKDFEDELATSHSIPSYLCDKSSDVDQFKTPLIPGSQTFRKVWLDTVDSEDSVTLETWVREEASKPGDLLLQMDIEGAEYRVLLATPAAVLHRFRVLVLEFHGLQKLNDPSVLSQVMLPIFRKLDSDFICVHAHANNGSVQFRSRPAGVACPRLLEVTLLRKDRLPGQVNKEGKVLIPHPLDIPRNARGKAPIFLDEWWLGGAERPLESQLKMAKDELAFWRYLAKQHGFSPPK
jgi:hypothetical protein